MRHRFHSLCPYFAMFPEAFAEYWLKRLTKKGDTVLDPFCGRGTLPFQALLMDRHAVGCDVNPVAYCISRAKTRAPSATVLRRRITMLETRFAPDQWEDERRQMPEFFSHAYRPATLRQLLYMRNVLAWKESDTDCMLAALILGSLHGESERSPVFLSNQMPHTIATKPDYSVRFWNERALKAPERDVFELLRDRVKYRYTSEPPTHRGEIYLTDMRELARERIETPIKAAITSPPYYDVTSYEEDQWLRLWFLGGKPHPTHKEISTDDRHSDVTKYWSLIGDMWRTLGMILADNARVVVRLGAVRLTPRQLVAGLEGCSSLAGRRVRLVSHETSKIERRQTDAFRPGSRGCKLEVDCLFSMA